MYVLSLLVIGRSLMVYKYWFLSRTSFADLDYSQRKHVSAQPSKDISMYSGGAQPFSLDDKGGE